MRSSRAAGKAWAVQDGEDWAGLEEVGAGDGMNPKVATAEMAGWERARGYLEAMMATAVAAGARAELQRSAVRQGRRQPVAG